MKRKIYNDLLRWKQRSAGRSALLIEGARRIGKSYITREFAKNEYASHLIIDFSTAPTMVKSWFHEYLEDIDILLYNLQLHYKTQLVPGDALVVFDEIQNCPKAREAIKSLVADGSFHYIETGSLVSIKKNVKDILIPSEEESIEMFPMDFEEFLWALGDEMLMPYIRRCFEAKMPMGDFHRRAMEYFRQYLIVGGMPQAVQTYVDTRDFSLVDDEKRRILTLYRNDIRKYADREEMRVSAIFDEIPAQLQKHEKKFHLAALSKSARMRNYANAFFWLSDAKIINCCYNTTEPSVGLRLSEERTTLKCYMGDTGLLISHAFNDRAIVSQELYQKLLFDKLEVNAGMIVENVVAQMLRAAGHKLFFFSKADNADAASRMEIDFLVSKPVITSRHNIVPIEVKSSKNYTLSSLKKCAQKYAQQITTPVVLHQADVQQKDGILYLPIYMTPLL
ncbi:MAG: AAA family ATPase [Bacteroidales bacterium]|nr:AAA family ATPase [Bacteroidales bacterium]